MNNSMRATKIKIAKDFVALHKEFDIPLGGGDDGFADIYVSLSRNILEQRSSSTSLLESSR